MANKIKVIPPDSSMLHDTTKLVDVSQDPFIHLKDTDKSASPSSSFIAGTGSKRKERHDEVLTDLQGGNMGNENMLGRNTGDNSFTPASGMDNSVIEGDNSYINASMIDQNVFDDHMNSSTIDMNNVNVSIIHGDELNGAAETQP